jgi:hypothetical protein
MVGIFFKKMLLEWSDTIQALVLNISLGKMEFWELWVNYYYGGDNGQK